MEKIIKEFYIYDFKELKEDIQKELIEKERDKQRDSYCEFYLEQDMEYKASELLEEYFGITDIDLKTYYDLSYSQGSGSMVEFNINIEDLNNKYKVFNEEEIRFIQDKGLINNISVYHNDNYYYHEYTFTIGFDSYYGNYCEYEEIKEDYNISEEDFNTIEERIDSLITCDNKHYTDNVFVKDIISMNKELTKYGYECIEYFWNCDKEEIISYLEDYKYLESGEIY